MHLLWRSAVVGCLLLPSSDGQSFKKKLEAARKKGLKGYDLIDAIDVWWGSNTPDYNGPFQQLDAMATKDKKVTLADWSAAGLPEDHFHYFDKDKNSRLDNHEVHIWHQQRQPARTMNLSEVHNPPKGHLQPLGGWKDPLPIEDLTYRKPYPHPRDFWKKHMDGYLPAILKGAQDGWPAMDWTPELLSEKYGWVEAKLEPKVEGRGNDTAYMDLDKISPRHRLNISEYLRQEKGKNMYVVSILPQVMAWDVAHPSVFLCGSRRNMKKRNSKPPYKATKHEYPHESKYDWMTHIFETNLWMASGKTRSQFHFDKEWNVNCLIKGRKRWIFINPFWYDKEFKAGTLQWSRGEKFRAENPLNNQWTDWIYLDPDNVDLIVQHGLRDVDYYEFIQEGGDCLFIPYAMLHQATKLDEGLQLAASWMFLPETIYEEDVCKDAPLEEDLPMAAMDTLYMYMGKGIIPQGYGDPLFFVQGLDSAMAKAGEKVLSLKTLKKQCTQGDAILKKVSRKEEKIKAIFDMVNAYAEDPKKGLRRDELRKVPLRIWAKPASEGDEEGALPCDDGEEYFPCDDKEFKKITDYVEDRLAAKPKTKDEAPIPKASLPKNTRSWPTGVPDWVKAIGKTRRAEL